MSGTDPHAGCRARTDRVVAAAEALRALPHSRVGEAVPVVLVAGLLGSTRMAAAASGPAWILWVVVAAWFLTALGVISHDCVHGSLSRRRAWNDGIGTLVLGLNFASFQAYRALHLAHHRFTGFDEDPSGDSPKVQRTTNLVVHLLLVFIPFGFPLFQILPGWLAAFGTDPVTYPPRVQAAIRRDFPRMLAIQLGLGAVLGFDGYRAYFWVWMLSMLMVIQLFGFNHVGTEAYTDCILCNTRNVHARPAFLEWLTLYAGYHVEHHLVPPVPWYRLPALHRMLEAEGGATWSVDGYLASQLGMVRSYLDQWRGLGPGPAPFTRPAPDSAHP